MNERIEIPINVSLDEKPEIHVTFEDSRQPLSASFGEVEKVNTSNYEELFNKPILNDKTIIGNKISSDYGLQDKMDVASQAEIEAILYID